MGLKPSQNPTWDLNPCGWDLNSQNPFWDSVLSCSVTSDSFQLARLFCPWGFSRQEYWSGLPCPPPGDLPNPGTEPGSPELQPDFLLSEPPGKPFGTLNQPRSTVFQLRSQIWFQHLTKLRFLMSRRRKNSVTDKAIGKRWILQKETHSTEEHGPSQRVSAAASECVVSFYGLGNFTG